MSDLISREDAIRAVFNTSIPFSATGRTARQMKRLKHDAVGMIKSLPSADRPTKVVAQITFDEEKLREIVKEAVERFKEEYEITDRPSGEWIVDEYGIYHCPFCHAINNTVYKSYCPNCGAKMEV